MGFRTNRFTFEKFPPPPPLLYPNACIYSFHHESPLCICFSPFWGGANLVVFCLILILFLFSLKCKLSLPLLISSIIYIYTPFTTMGWLWLVGSMKLLVSFAKEPYKRDNILQKRPIILSILLTIATPYLNHAHMYGVATISRLRKIIGL